MAIAEFLKVDYRNHHRWGDKIDRSGCIVVGEVSQLQLHRPASYKASTWLACFSSPSHVCTKAKNLVFFAGSPPSM